MNKLFKLSIGAILGIFMTASITGCKKDKGGQATETDTKYSAILCVGSWPNTAYYIADFNSLTSGEISVKGNGAELTGKVYAQDVIQKDGFYYHANSSSGRIGKYHTENGALITDKEVPFTWLDWDSYTWINNNTLAIFGVGTNDNQVKEGRYAIVNITDMSITTGTLTLEALPTGFSTYRISFAEYRDSKLFIGYSFASEDWSNYPVMNIYKQFNVAVVNYATKATEKNLSVTTTISATPTVYAPTSFIDENNDIYFITDPVSGYDYESPSLVYRIKSGTTELDASYTFNLSENTNNGMGAAMWYIGNGKAIVRTRVAGQSIDTDHSFSLINTQTGTFIKTLDLPADKGERMVQAVIVEDGNAYIAVNAVDRDFIWEYNPTTDKLTQGAEFVGGIDYILRIEKKK